LHPERRSGGEIERERDRWMRYSGQAGSLEQLVGIDFSIIPDENESHYKYDIIDVLSMMHVQ
jgi:hypothetical protein